MKKGTLHIGTSGWQYAHWKGVFYPQGLKTEEEFDFYATVFQTVEVNNSFYKLPGIATFNAWRKAAPKGFIFSVKGSQFITHFKKLKLDKKGIRLFFSRIKYLKDKLGPILFQLPPRWKFNAERLEHFLSILPDTYQYAFEFRDKTWFNQQAYDLLKTYGCAFCIYELAGFRSPKEITSGLVYIRLHGPGANKYQGKYSLAQLKRWAKQCKQWQKEGKDVYLYFDNDQAGYAALNAQKLSQLPGIK